MPEDPERAHLSICTYCLQAIDIREPGVMRRTLAWMDVPTPQIGYASLPVLLNEWAHRDCVITRAREREETLRRMGEAGDRRLRSVPAGGPAPATTPATTPPGPGSPT